MCLEGILCQEIGEERKESFSSTHLGFYGWGPINQTNKRQLNKQKSKDMFTNTYTCIHMGALSDGQLK